MEKPGLQTMEISRVKGMIVVRSYAMEIIRVKEMIVGRSQPRMIVVEIISVKGMIVARSYGMIVQRTHPFTFIKCGHTLTERQEVTTGRGAAPRQLV
jgi:hypothetical protein